ncbi:MAG: hypothetical protein IPM29_27530 [Planctomycetes bacterium]|nr:hypothetical protein [Planctomycetota bacterium]
MDTLFFYAAVIGGTLLGIQTLLALFGIGVDADVGADHGFGGHGDPGGHAGAGANADFGDGGAHTDASAHGHSDASLLKKLSVQTITAFTTFFGLTGLALRHSDIGIATSSVLALGAGLSAIWIVGLLMGSLARLQSSGNLKLENAVGSPARVHVRVPANGGGTGLVHLTLQGRRVERKARTDGPELPTGSSVLIANLDADGVFHVTASTE